MGKDSSGVLAAKIGPADRGGLFGQTRWPVRCEHCGQELPSVVDTIQDGVALVQNGGYRLIGDTWTPTEHHRKERQLARERLRTGSIRPMGRRPSLRVPDRKLLAVNGLGRPPGDQHPARRPFRIDETYLQARLAEASGEGPPVPAAKGLLTAPLPTKVECPRCHKVSRVTRPDTDGDV